MSPVCYDSPFLSLVAQPVTEPFPTSRSCLFWVHFHLLPCSWQATWSDPWGHCHQKRTVLWGPWTFRIRCSPDESVWTSSLSSWLDRRPRGSSLSRLIECRQISSIWALLCQCRLISWSLSFRILLSSAVPSHTILQSLVQFRSDLHLSLGIDD
jgi:hypothetical protein